MSVRARQGHAASRMTRLSHSTLHEVEVGLALVASLQGAKPEVTITAFGQEVVEQVTNMGAPPLPCAAKQGGSRLERSGLPTLSVSLVKVVDREQSVLLSSLLSLVKMRMKG